MAFNTEPFYRSRFYQWFARAVLRRTARCLDCPFWRFHRMVETELTSAVGNIHIQTLAGSCRLDKPILITKGGTGWSWRAWAADDVCFRHPLFVKKPAGVRASYAPGAPGHDLAGFDAAPSLEDALRLAQGDHGNIDANRIYQRFGMGDVTEAFKPMKVRSAFDTRNRPAEPSKPTEPGQG